MFPFSLMASSVQRKPPAVWWYNALFFCGMHLAAAYGVYRRPPSTVLRAILVATVVLWQLANFGCAYMHFAFRFRLLQSNQRITIGYHRLYSHRSFNASLGVRAVLALLGASAFQGSIKVKHVFSLVRAKFDRLCLSVVVSKHPSEAREA
jgi:stearoyl-CoA desaturase (delta-9 desaturase)